MALRELKSNAGVETQRRGGRNSVSDRRYEGVLPQISNERAWAGVFLPCLAGARVKAYVYGKTVQEVWRPPQ